MTAARSLRDSSEAHFSSLRPRNGGSSSDGGRALARRRRRRRAAAACAPAGALCATAHRSLCSQNCASAFSNTLSSSVLRGGAQGARERLAGAATWYAGCPHALQARWRPQARRRPTSSLRRAGERAALAGAAFPGPAYRSGDCQLLHWPPEFHLTRATSRMTWTFREPYARAPSCSARARDLALHLRRTGSLRTHAHSPLRQTLSGGLCKGLQLAQDGQGLLPNVRAGRSRRMSRAAGF